MKTTENAPAIVDFHGTQLLSKKLEDGTIVVAMKPIVLGMGLAWQPQHEKLQTQKEKFNCHDIVMVVTGGKERLMLSMPLTKLNGWLFSINPAKIPDPAVRTTVELYQEECFQALYDYWWKGEAVNPAFKRYQARLPSLQTVLNTFIVSIKAAKAAGQTHRESLENANACTIKAYGIDCLDLLSIDPGKIPDPELKKKVREAKVNESDDNLADRFFSGLASLTPAQRVPFMEVRNKRVMIRLNQAAAALTGNGVSLGPMPSLHQSLYEHPAFVSSRISYRGHFGASVSSVIRAWEFKASALCELGFSDLAGGNGGESC